MLIRSPLLLFTVLLVLAGFARADSAQEIDAASAKALEQLKGLDEDAEYILQEAVAVLVFPDMVKMGFGVGGQYGEGVLLVDGKPDSYYAATGASFGLPLGARFKTQVIVFRTAEVLQNFRRRRGWTVGVDGGVVLVKSGASDTLNSRELSDPVVGFVFSNEGLLYNLSFDGEKITRIAR